MVRAHTLHTVVVPKADSPSETWTPFFHNLFQKTTDADRSSRRDRFGWPRSFEDTLHQLADLGYEAYRRTLDQVSQSWSVSRQKLFRLWGAFSFLVQLEQKVKDSPYWRYHLNFQDMDKVFLATAVAFTAQEWPPVDDRDGKAFLSLLRDRVIRLTENEVFPWLDIYRLFWGNVLGGTPWALREADEIAAISQHKTAPHGVKESSFQCTLSLLRIHFLFMAREDDAVRQEIEGMADRGLVVHWSALFLYLHGLKPSGQLERLLSWLRWFEATGKRCFAPLDQYEQAETVKFWLQVAEPCGAVDEMLDAVRPSVPDYMYRQLLVNVGRYRQWAELCLLHGRLDRGDHYWKAVEKVDPAVMLPLYHHAIVRQIAQKNRPAYQEAVKMLKKLRAHYKKLKQNDRFERYLARILEENGRLRAFQEELVKGKLITP
ncbi:conserved hypothetical protein [Heliomicrobium modesticaldum Ice1]|uniref:Uncharacterized protein n=1 Tax=Heliobacterium modesticaldum (strain ATCC 51547 / Ice1) TaxID=498761 RepID=B0TCS7_HELMI|nr:hypothetical protein [Heliomicrobium modesticaldum]ABZ84103.1 conserved hypothetical protein [Heliomicrobium modesticaldum Ice1]